MEGTCRSSWHRGWWDEPSGKWHWTCRGLRGIQSKSQVLVASVPTEPKSTIKNSMPLKDIISDDRCDSSIGDDRCDPHVRPVSPAMLRDDPAQQGVISDRTSALDPSGKPSVGQGGPVVEEITGSLISPLALCDGSREGAPQASAHSAPGPATKPMQTTPCKAWEGPTEEERRHTAEDDMNSSDDTWSPGTSGRKGHARRDCRLCHHPRGDMLEQRGQLCCECKRIMREDGRRKTIFLRFTPYRRVVRAESLRRRKDKTLTKDCDRDAQDRGDAGGYFEDGIPRVPASVVCKRRPAAAYGPSPGISVHAWSPATQTTSKNFGDAL